MGSKLSQYVRCSLARCNSRVGYICAGYYYDPGSGYYYDANSGLYFDSSLQQWLALDPETGQFSAPQQPDAAPSTAAESSIGDSISFLACSSSSLLLVMDG